MLNFAGFNYIYKRLWLNCVIQSLAKTVAEFFKIEPSFIKNGTRSGFSSILFKFTNQTHLNIAGNFI